MLTNLTLDIVRLAPFRVDLVLTLLCGTLELIRFKDQWMGIPAY
jgi:hypothetical protein